MFDVSCQKASGAAFGFRRCAPARAWTASNSIVRNVGETLLASFWSLVNDPKCYRPYHNTDPKRDHNFEGLFNAF